MGEPRSAALGAFGEAKAQDDSLPLSAKPVGNAQVDLLGRLAEAGSSSALPTIALAGGAAVALRVSTILIVCRRMGVRQWSHCLTLQWPGLPA
ncbi:hypothetical protein EF913_34520 [Streptomyces sp. WAC04189]|uniref:hypothetical protein n=1 Tax=Streptomyces TaxID=1883 RepID=UPI000EE4CFBB|nr:MULTISPECIES: hypothetical protein [Streptomyces]NEC71769.1 hypothetical protein [Streptomyces rochei]RIH58787.1 hypothetical protein D3C59_32840 [Streptomyces sp. SHP22-7]MBU8547388.1 hypothetical protein [Streptomyces sp. Osf17]MBU8554153.1 hypothetical protein [Streptomyces sp. Babs14]NUV96372.1 hypothetical protein [Streptomyces sp. KAI 90]